MIRIGKRTKIVRIIVIHITEAEYMNHATSTINVNNIISHVYDKICIVGLTDNEPVAVSVVLDMGQQRLFFILCACVVHTRNEYHCQKKQKMCFHR